MGGDWYDPCAVYGFKLDQSYFSIFRQYIYDNYLQEYDDVLARDEDGGLRIRECIELIQEIKNIPIYTMLNTVGTRWEYVDIDDSYVNIYIGTMYSNTDTIECDFNDAFDFDKISMIFQELDIDLGKLPPPQLYIGCV